jgi:mRNA interferase MazF
MLQDYFLALVEWWRASVVLRTKKSKPLFKEGEIWWCSVGMNVGVEIFGKGSKFTRPVLIFKKFNANSFLGIPLTSKPKDGPWYVSVHCAGVEGRGILSQIRSFDAKRLNARMATLTDAEFAAVREAFLAVYGDKPPEICRPTSGKRG